LQGQINAVSINEGIRASVKDPLWFLARQWQLGEFKAENCGSIAKVDVRSDITPIDTVFQTIAPISNKIDGIQIKDGKPIEPLVELKKTISGADSLSDALEAPDSWNCKKLEYQFSIGTQDKRKILTAKEYFGDRSDWYNFSIRKIDDSRASSPETRVIPQSVSFPGMPKARWWQFEDENIDLGDIQRPNLNFLSTLLTEFTLLYSNDWFVIPVQQPIGSLRKVNELKVTDVFGNINQIKAHGSSQNNDSEDQIFTLFSLSIEDKGNSSESKTDSSILFLPNTLVQYIQGEALEEVVFSRDEMANLVWAIERKYFEKGEIYNRDDEKISANQNDSQSNQDSLPKYKIMSPLRKNWIPYVSVQNSKTGQIYFRRGRTVIDEQQYRTILIKDSTRIWEEEIPATPILLTQNVKMIVYDAEKWDIVKQVGNDGIIINSLQNTGNQIRLVWIARKKNHSVRQHSSGLKFDYLIE
jgi:hypothetical protein